MAKGNEGTTGDAAWLVCERLSNGDRKYYLAKLTASSSRKQIVGAITARWSCEQAHQQIKEELGWIASKAALGSVFIITPS